MKSKWTHITYHTNKHALLSLINCRNGQKSPSVMSILIHKAFGWAPLSKITVTNSIKYFLQYHVNKQTLYQVYKQLSGDPNRGARIRMGVTRSEWTVVHNVTKRFTLSEYISSVKWWLWQQQYVESTKEQFFVDSNFTIRIHVAQTNLAQLKIRLGLCALMLCFLN